MKDVALTPLPPTPKKTLRLSCPRPLPPPPCRYVDRLSSNLQRKAGQGAKMLAAADETQARQQESRAMLASLQPKVGDGHHDQSPFCAILSIHRVIINLIGSCCPPSRAT